MAPLVLMTDFGTKDGNVGVMKGVILNIFSQAQIVDLSHNISPQNVREAALILARTYRFFPPETTFVIVVDPGVGTARRPIAARIGDYRFVLPDNGILTPLLDLAKEQALACQVVYLNKPDYWLETVSNVFHGRDIFAPVGAHLAAGVDIKNLGDIIDDPVKIRFPEPVPTAHGLLGEVIHIDHFGNISTNIRKHHLGDQRTVTVHLRGHSIPGMYNTFGEKEPGELMALLGSTDYLIVSEVNGSAAGRTDAALGDPVEVFFQG